MPTTETFKRWLSDAQAQGATHMLVYWDSFDGEDGDYPVPVIPPTTVSEAMAAHHDKLMECYRLDLDWGFQLAEPRAMHTEDAGTPCNHLWKDTHVWKCKKCGAFA